MPHLGQYDAAAAAAAALASTAAFAGMQAMLSTHRNRQLPGARIMHQGRDQITFLPQQLCHLLLLRLKEELHDTQTHICRTTQGEEKKRLRLLASSNIKPRDQIRRASLQKNPKDFMSTSLCLSCCEHTSLHLMPFCTIAAPIFCCNIRVQDRHGARSCPHALSALKATVRENSECCD